MIDKNVVAAMMAGADQIIARRRNNIERLVAVYKGMLAEGSDPVVASGLLVWGLLQTQDQVEANQQLAVAVMMLAEAPRPEGGAPC